MKKHYLQLIIFGILIICSCKQNSKKEVKQTKSTPLQQTNSTPPIKEKTESSVFGVDISYHNNNEVDLIDIRKDSLHFIICKATEGVTFIDPKFKENWKKIKEKGFIRGVYHFYRTDDDPITQANFFLNTINNLENTDIPPVIDFEEGGINKSQSIESVQSMVLSFMNEIEKKANVKPIIYTDINTANKYLNNSIFQKYHLWIANYNGKEKPNLPNTWKTKGYLIWQKTDSYKVINTTSDADTFNGNLTEFKEFIKNSYTKK